jgi:hypothetical protein
MQNLLTRLKRWMLGEPPSRPRWNAPVHVQLNRIEHKINRLGWHWTQYILNSSISGPTAPTSPTSTATGPDTASPASRLARKLLPKLRSFLWERLLAIVLHYLAPIGLALWLAGRERVEALWAWLTLHWPGWLTW